MATVTHVTAIEHVAKMPGEDQELLEAVVCNDDNMTCGNIVSVDTGTDEAITAPNHDGISEFKDMPAAARRSIKDGTTSGGTSSQPKTSSPASTTYPCGRNRSATVQSVTGGNFRGPRSLRQRHGTPPAAVPATMAARPRLGQPG